MSARRLDLAARSIDLLNSLTEIASSKSSITGIALEVGQWLGRERLNRHQLEHCLREAQGLIRPNSNGKIFCDQVRTNVHENGVRPFLVQPSGALGRLLLDDPFLTWLVSTTSSLFQFHGEKFITDSLIDLLIYARHDATISDFDLAWHPNRILLEPVLKKIVSSVWFNVVNSGNSNLSIPQEFLDVCTRGHHLDSKKLAKILCLLQQKHSKIMIQSEYIITNLAFWLLTHYHGRLRLVVAGVITYDCALGSEPCEVEFRIDQACDKSGQCTSSDIPDHFRPPPDFFVFHDLNGRYEKLFSGEFDTNDSQKAESQARCGLYDISAKYPRSGLNGRDSITIRIYGTAQRILEWVLQLKISSGLNTDQLLFNTTIFDNAPHFTVGDLLAKVPALLNRGERSAVEHCVVFADIDDDGYGKYCFGQDDSTSAKRRRTSASRRHIPENVLKYFPILRDLLDAVAVVCQCGHCSNLRLVGPRNLSTGLKHGCYRHSVFSDVMSLISHGIADGFGANDTSANYNTDLDVFRVTKLLARIRNSMEVSWEEWFALAASVFLGCPAVDSSKESALISDDVKTVQRARTTVAVQYGSLAVTAPWLDVTKQLKIEGCFSFIPVSGRLSVPAGFDGPLQTTQSEFAVIRTRHTEQIIPGTHVALHASGTSVSAIDDDDAVFNDTFLSATGEEEYTLLMRFSSQTSSRLVDPSRAMLKASQQPPQMACTHPEKQNSLSQWEGNLLISPVSFDELLLVWGSSIQNRNQQDEDATRFQQRAEDDMQPDGEPAIGTSYMQPPTQGEIDRFQQGARRNVLPQVVHVSKALDSYTKINLALALCSANVTVTNDVYRGSCLECAVMQCAQAKAANGIENATQDRWIINTARKLRSDEATLRTGELPFMQTRQKTIAGVAHTKRSLK